MTLTEKKAEVVAKITDLYAENIQVIPVDELSPVAGAGATEGLVSKEFRTIFGTRTNKKGQTIYVGAKG